MQREYARFGMREQRIDEAFMNIMARAKYLHRMNNRLSFWRRLALVFAVICLGLLITMTQVKAHSWYDPECCSDKDCEPIPHETVQVTPAGYLWAGILIPFAEARISMDRDYHVCRGVYTGTLIQPSFKKPCFYAPMGGT
jgi:hypothetical protein